MIPQISQYVNDSCTKVLVNPLFLFHYDINAGKNKGKFRDAILKTKYFLLCQQVSLRIGLKKEVISNQYLKKKLI